jgi:hypothetical protein
MRLYTCLLVVHVHMQTSTHVHAHICSDDSRVFVLRTTLRYGCR